MSKKQEFINFIEEVFNEANIGPDHMSENVRLYWEALKTAEDKEDKPTFTDNGKLVMTYMQDNAKSTSSWKSKDIAEGLFISSRTVSGTMRKLVTDGFVEKIGQDPIVYTLTEKGKTIEIN